MAMSVWISPKNTEI